MFKLLLASILFLSFFQTAYAESTKDSIYCLAKNIYFEARNQSKTGQQAVAFVTLNRVKSELYPNTICKVVYQGVKNPDGTMKKDQCHFSWYCDNKPDIPKEKESFKLALSIAIFVYTYYNYIPDPTHGAIMYHANYVKPRWARDYAKTAKIEKHIFYK